MDRRSFVVSALAAPFLGTAAFAHERLGMATPQPGDWKVYVSKANQRMAVFYNGQQIDEWLCSTARSGKVTPSGTFYPYWLSRHHRSSLYNNAPMPFSIFYSGNFAIHGTDQISRLGSRASAGCVRLHPDNAGFLFQIPKNYGLKALQINVA